MSMVDLAAADNKPNAIPQPQPFIAGWAKNSKIDTNIDLENKLMIAENSVMLETTNNVVSGYGVVTAKSVHQDIKQEIPVYTYRPRREVKPPDTCTYVYNIGTACGLNTMLYISVK